MPELPEVEVARRVLASVLDGSRIERVDVRDRLVGGGSEAARGLAVEGVERRGKQLRIGLEGGALFAHLGMSGEWVAVKADSPALLYERVRIVARRGSGTSVAAYVDPRRLGRLRFSTKEPATWLALGPDALKDRLDPRAFHARFQARRGPIKVALLDQHLLAGVGNIHAIEALWRAGIDPRSRADALSLADVRSLLRAVRASLAAGLRGHERSARPSYVRKPGASNPFRIYGHAGEPCPRCAAPLKKIVQAGRGTTFCAGCQRRVRR